MGEATEHRGKSDRGPDGIDQPAPITRRASGLGARANSGGATTAAATTTSGMMPRNTQRHPNWSVTHPASAGASRLGRTHPADSHAYITGCRSAGTPLPHGHVGDGGEAAHAGTLQDAAGDDEQHAAGGAGDDEPDHEQRRAHEERPAGTEAVRGVGSGDDHDDVGEHVGGERRPVERVTAELVGDRGQRRDDGGGFEGRDRDAE